MKVPGIALVFKTIDVTHDYEFLEYCKAVNEIIKEKAITRGKIVPSDFYGTIYRYKTKNCIYQYNDSDYGNDLFAFMVNDRLWDDIPSGLNRALINDDGFNQVYEFQDSPDRKILMHHIPGTWVRFLR